MAKTTKPTSRKPVVPKAQKRFGTHTSTAGGVHTAFERAVEAGCDVMQIFVKNQRQWRARPLDDESVQAWTQARQASGIETVIAHDAYLINLAAPQDTVWETSIEAFIDEVTRCAQLGIRWLVTHPGAHGGNGESWGIQRVVSALRRIYDRVGDSGVGTLLEVTAGQGTTLGYRLEHLAEIIDASGRPGHLGVCLDTCHLLAAGYDIAREDGYTAFMEGVQATFGASAVKCIHMNDSKKPLGSRVDRHEHIGKGAVGRSAFARFINDRRFAGVPMILETPKEKDARGRDMDRINLAALRGMIARG